MKKLKTCILYPVSCILLFYSNAFSFTIPERLEYDLTWAGIKAGTASLEVVNDGNKIKIISIAQSAKWVSVFYKVDDRVESTLIRNPSLPFVGQPLNYRLKLREGRRRSDKEAIFDLNNTKITYINHLKNEEKEFDLPASVFDPLSGFYYLRTLQLEVGRPVYVTIFDDKKVWDVEIQVLRKEHIEIPAGKFNTIVVKPLMQSEGIFYRKGAIYIWLTDDGKRIPVMVKTKVSIGSITATLVRGNY
jgi:hypothetical protein